MSNNLEELLKQITCGSCRKHYREDVITHSCTILVCDCGHHIWIGGNA